MFFFIENEATELCVTMWKSSSTIAVIKYHSVENVLLRWPFQVLIAFKRGKPGVMVHDEK